MKPVTNNKPKKAVNLEKEKELAFRRHFGRFLKEYEGDKELILEAYMNATSRHQLNVNLQKHFDNSTVKDIRQKLSGLIKDMPGL